MSKEIQFLHWLEENNGGPTLENAIIARKAKEIFEKKTYSVKIKRVEAENLESPNFFGKGITEEEVPRLTGQLLKVFQFMLDGMEHTQQEISLATGVSLISTRNRISDLRQPRWGCHTLIARRIKGPKWGYRMVPNLDSLTYKLYSANNSLTSSQS